MKQRIIIASPEKMEEFAAEFSKTLKGGEVLALRGELGAGKTAFAKGLAKAFGINEVVQSPTFLLMKCYAVGRRATVKPALRTLCHVDAYRIKKEAELLAIGLSEHLNDPGTVTIIEWADLVPALIPAHAVHMEFLHGKNDAERVINIARR